MLVILVWEPKLHICLCVCVASPGWMRCSDWSERKDNCTYIVMNRAGIGMSVNISWFPDFGHIMAGIFKANPTFCI